MNTGDLVHVNHNASVRMAEFDGAKVQGIGIVDKVSDGYVMGRMIKTDQTFMCNLSDVVPLNDDETKQHRRHMSLRNKYIELLLLENTGAVPDGMIEHFGEIYDDIVKGGTYSRGFGDFQKTYRIMMNMLNFQGEIKRDPQLNDVVVQAGEKTMALTCGEVMELRNAIALQKHHESFVRPTHECLSDFEENEQQLRDQFYNRIESKLNRLNDEFEAEMPF